MGEIDLIKRIQKLEHDVEQLRALDSRDLLLPTYNFATLGMVITTDATIAGIVLPRTPIYINRFQINCRVQTTNNGSNYWTFTLVRTSDNANVASVNTSALAASSTTYSRLNASVGSNIPAGQIGLYINANRTGSPGTLDVIGLSVNAA